MMNKLDKKLILNIVIMLTVCTTTKAMPISVGTDSVEKADSLPRRHHDLAMTLNKKTGTKLWPISIWDFWEAPISCTVYNSTL